MLPYSAVPPEKPLYVSTPTYLERLSYFPYGITLKFVGGFGGVPSTYGFTRPSMFPYMKGRSGYDA